MTALLRVVDADELVVAVAWRQSYAWPSGEDRDGPWLNTAGSRVLDQDHALSYDPDTHACRTCGHGAAYRADHGARGGLGHATHAGPWQVLAEIEGRAGWAAAVRGWMSGRV